MELRVMVVDPVCSEKIKEDEALCIVFYSRRTYFFCGNECAWKFTKDPESFISDFEEI